MKRGILLFLILLLVVSCSTEKDLGAVAIDDLSSFTQYEQFLALLEEGDKGRLTINTPEGDTLVLLSKGKSNEGYVIELIIEKGESAELFPFDGTNAVCRQKDEQYFKNIGSLKGERAQEAVSSLIYGMMIHVFDQESNLCYEGTMLEVLDYYNKD